jgi:hypothetical protein
MKKSKIVVYLLVLLAISVLSIVSQTPQITSVPPDRIIEVHPLAGKTIQWGVTASSTTGLETTQPLVEEIIQEDLNEYAELLSLDIDIDLLVEDNQGTASHALEKTQTYKAMGINIVQGDP